MKERERGSKRERETEKGKEREGRKEREREREREKEGEREREGGVDRKAPERKKRFIQCTCACPNLPCHGMRWCDGTPLERENGATPCDAFFFGQSQPQQEG